MVHLDHDLGQGHRSRVHGHVMKNIHLLLKVTFELGDD